jgi:hypothetical protein
MTNVAVAILSALAGFLVWVAQRYFERQAAGRVPEFDKPFYVRYRKHCLTSDRLSRSVERNYRIEVQRYSAVRLRAKTPAVLRRM